MACHAVFPIQDEFKIPKKPTTMSENGELEGQRGSGSDSEWEDASEEGDDDDGLPSYEFRFECAKMLLELEDTTETAIQVMCLAQIVTPAEAAGACLDAWLRGTRCTAWDNNRADVVPCLWLKPTFSPPLRPAA